MKIVFEKDKKLRYLGKRVAWECEKCGKYFVDIADLKPGVIKHRSRGDIVNATYVSIKQLPTLFYIYKKR